MAGARFSQTMRTLTHSLNTPPGWRAGERAPSQYIGMQATLSDIMRAGRDGAAKVFSDCMQQINKNREAVKQENRNKKKNPSEQPEPRNKGKFNLYVMTVCFA